MKIKNHQPLFTVRVSARISRFVSFVALTALVTLGLPVLPASALTQMTTTRIYMNRQQAGLTTGQTLELFFTPATTLTGSTNHVIITFPNDAANNTKWCRTAGTLTLTAETEPSNTTQVSGESATSLLGSVTGACTQTPDTFTISAVGALQAGTKYGVKLAANTAVMGTGDAANNIKVAVKTQQAAADTDTQTIALSLVSADQYLVSANIDATLTVTLSATTLNLGVLSTSAVSYQGVTSTVSTSANGYVSLVQYSGAMTNGVDTIADAGGTATAGTSGFGASTSKSSQTIGTSDASPACSTTQQSSAGPYVATSLSTGFKQFASAGTSISLDATTLCFLAAISGTQAPGSYSTTVTLVTTAKF